MTISGELKILSVHFKNLDKFRYIYVPIYNKILHGYPRSQNNIIWYAPVLNEFFGTKFLK